MRCNHRIHVASMKAVLCLALTFLIGTFPLHAMPPGQPVGSSFGVVHSGGKYSLPTRDPACDQLNEGADRIADLGCRTIKLWLTYDPVSAYPNFTGSYAWPTNLTNLKQLLQTGYFQEVLSREEFDAYIFVASEYVPFDNGQGWKTTNWKDGLSAAEKTVVTNQFRDATAYLLTNYAGTGKTFIFSNREGDNALNFDVVTNAAEQQLAIQGIKDWLSARQAGVRAGRALAGNPAGVAVYNAAEMNYNPGANGNLPISTNLCMVNCIIPFLDCDLYSWSNWSSQLPGDEINVIRGLDYLKSHAPASDAASGFGEENVFMGEFGSPEEHFYTGTNHIHSAQSDAEYSAQLAKLADYALRWGARYFTHWQIYDNGTVDGVAFDKNNPTVLTETQFRGIWLIRPRANINDPLSYSFTSAYGHFENLIGRQMHDDPLANTNYADQVVGSFSFTTSSNTWNEGDRTRAYRTTSGSTVSVSYCSSAPIVDWNIKAFISGGGTTAVGRIRGYTSTNGVNWSSPFDFSEVDNIVPDPSVSTWRRIYLGPPASGIPSNTTWLRVELYGATSVTSTQLGHIRLFTQPVTLYDDELNTLNLTAAASSNLYASTTTNTYTEGDVGRAIRTDTNAAWMVYEGANMQNLRFKILNYGATYTNKFTVSASPDGIVGWTPVALAYDTPVQTATGWWRVWARDTGFPEGTRFVKISWVAGGNSWTPQVGQVKFDYTP